MQSRSLSVYINQTLGRTIAAIVIFAALIALTARITIFLPFTPVPITLQVLAVILAGLVLGSRSGALAALTYLGMIAIGLPFDASGIGPAAFFGATAGYLIGYVPAAFVVGWLAERFSVQYWWGNFVAALAGVGVIYLFGAAWLGIMLGSWQKAWALGVAPFILIDIVKAAVAAGVAESGKLLLRR
ncbi:MAG TPA: biotin transporter BioY [Anaerolineae bacterium]|nr:biotin transporter BioY [Anaerolineae bacterium]